jgi:TPR repeat protein
LAFQGHPDGTNNHGFCLEHGRGVEQYIQFAAEYYRFAADHGHSEGGLNYRHCLRLLGRWDPPDCFSQVSVRPPSKDCLAKLLVNCLKEPKALDRASLELIASIERLKSSVSAEAKLQVRTVTWSTRSEFGRGDSSVVTLVRSPEGILLSVKAAETSRDVELIKREIAIHTKFKHPLILEFRRTHSGRLGRSTIVTEVAGNGLLVSHLPSVKNAEMCQLRGEIRMARIIVGIALAMRYLHSQRVIHCNLNPDNILLDWDWNVRISDFRHSISPDKLVIPNANPNWPVIDSHYLTPDAILISTVGRVMFSHLG